MDCYFCFFHMWWLAFPHISRVLPCGDLHPKFGRSEEIGNPVFENWKFED